MTLKFRSRGSTAPFDAGAATAAEPPAPRPGQSGSLDEESDLAAMILIRADWDRMTERLILGPFGTHAWNVAWLESFRARYEEPFLLVRRHEGAVDAIAPLVRVRESAFGLPVRCLRFVGGRESCRKALLIHGDPGPFIADFVGHLTRKGRRPWDLMVLDDVPSDAPWIVPLKSACASAGLHMVDAPDSTNQFLGLPDSYEAFHAGLKSSLKRNLKRRVRQLDACGDVSFQRFSAAACTPVQMEWAARIEAKSWKGVTGVGIFQTASGLQFHERILGTRERGFEPDLAFLNLDGNPIAFQYGFVQDDCYFAYNTSFDPALKSYSPGVLLRDALIRDLISSGMRTFDLLVGEATYKADLTETFRVNRRLTVFNRTPYGRSLRRLHGLKARVKPLIPRGVVQARTPEAGSDKEPVKDS